MNMGPRTWYQVPPRELRYPEVSRMSEKSRTFQKSKITQNYICTSLWEQILQQEIVSGPPPAVWTATDGPARDEEVS